MTNPESKIQNPKSAPPALQAFAALMRREFTVELRTKSLLTSMGLFAALSVVVVGLAVRTLPVNETYHRFVLGMLWVTSIFAAVVGLNRAAQADRGRNFLGALLLIPHDPALVYVSRLVSAMVFLLATQALLVLLAIPLLRFGMFDQPLLLLVVPLADLGILAPGVLLASGTSRTRGGESLLTIALLPIAVPVFASATGITDALQGGLGFAGAQPWLLLLATCDAMFLGMGLLLFGKLNEG